MSVAFMIEKVLTSSILIFFFYTCFVTLALCIAYYIDEAVRGYLEKKREENELLERSNRPVDAVIDEVYAA